MAERVAKLPNRLKGFEKADTGSQFEGWVAPGTYVVLEERSGGETDYARLLVPALGAGDTWICTRWKNQVYARPEDVLQVAAPPALELSEEDRPVPESRLRAVAGRFSAFHYDFDDAFYPFRLRGVNVPQAGPKTNNCCTFVEALLVGAWQDEYDDFAWSPEQHRQMMIMSRDDFFSPVTAAVEAGLAVAAHEDSAPRPWTLVQGWREQWNKGHTFVIVAHHPPTDRVLTIESNSGYRMNGVGWRMVGNLRDHAAPPASWWENDKLWTWQRVRAVYRFRRCAWLEVTDLEWGAL
jgi:hypothetical protein